MPVIMTSSRPFVLDDVEAGVEVSDEGQSGFLDIHIGRMQLGNDSRSRVEHPARKLRHEPTDLLGPERVGEIENAKPGVLISAPTPPEPRQTGRSGPFRIMLLQPLQC